MRRRTKYRKKDVTNLFEAIKGNKYWHGKLGSKEVIYVVALTRAELPVAEGYQARATYLGKVTVSEEASPYCRRGRILALVKKRGRYIARSVITWPAFIKLMRGRADRAYELIVREEFPYFVHQRSLRRVLA